MGHIEKPWFAIYLVEDGVGGKRCFSLDCVTFCICNREQDIFYVCRFGIFDQRLLHSWLA